MARPSKYPWDKWFRQDRFAIPREAYPDTGNASMVQQVRDAASARGLKKVRVRESPTGDGLLVEIGQRPAKK